MIVSAANSISRVQHGLTLRVPQLLANKLPFAMRFTFPAIQFTAMICSGCHTMGLWSSLQVLVSMVMPNAAINSSKFSL